MIVLSNDAALSTQVCVYADYATVENAMYHSVTTTVWLSHCRLLSCFQPRMIVSEVQSWYQPILSYVLTHLIQALLDD